MLDRLNLLLIIDQMTITPSPSPWALDWLLSLLLLCFCAFHGIDGVCDYSSVATLLQWILVRSSPGHFYLHKRSLVNDGRCLLWVEKSTVQSPSLMVIARSLEKLEDFEIDFGSLRMM